MAKIVFTIWPAHGHLNPTLKLARKLQRAGHRVCYLGLSELEMYITSQGFEYFRVLDEAGSLEGLMKTGAYDSCAQIGKALQRIRPDLLIVDGILCDIGVAARNMGIPTTLVSLSLDERRLWMGGPEAADPASDLPALVLCPAEFDFPNAPRRKGGYYVEASIDLERAELHPFPWDKLDQSKPLIYCSLGSHSNEYEQSQKVFLALTDAIERKPEWQLVLAMGAQFAASICRPIPSNSVVVEWAPQLEILKRASIMVTHGGLGAVKECVFFGVPMIVFPMKWDQNNNAARVKYHGIGVEGDSHNITCHQINSYIDILHNDPSFKAKSESMSKVFRRAEEAGRGAKIIERVLSAYSGSGRVYSEGTEVTQDSDNTTYADASNNSQRT